MRCAWFAPGQPNDFEIYSNDSLKSAFITSRICSSGRIIISLIALVAAGIGIMKHHTVSVTERTKRNRGSQVIGARSPDILRQFLTEAVVHSEAAVFWESFSASSSAIC